MTPRVLTPVMGNGAAVFTRALMTVSNARAKLCLRLDYFTFGKVCMNGLQQMAKRLTGLTMRRSGIALGIWGEAGIGKTHTASALLRGTPCQSWSVHATQALEGIVRQVPRPKKMAVWLEQSLERLVRGEPFETAAFVQTFTALLATNAPLVLHIEDLHEATPDRLELWQQLALAVTRTRGVGLIATSRVQLPNGFEVIRLEPLDRTASDALLEAEAGATLPIDALAWIFEHARGNSLFTLEFFRFLARHGFVWNDTQRWHWRVPERLVMPVTVEATIERAISEACVDTSTRAALNARAYLESLEPNLNLEPEVWAYVAGLDLEALERAERTLRARGVLNDSGFVHPLFREVPANGLNARDRKVFANQALEVLPLEAAAVFVSDAQLGPERSLEWLKRAAETSRTPGRWLALAVEYSSGSERARLALEAARELTASDLHQAQKLYRVALEGNSDPAVTLEFVAFLAPHQPEEAKALFEALPKDVRTSTQGVVARFQMMVVVVDLSGIIDYWRNEFGSSSDLSPDALVHVMQSLLLLDRCDDAIRLADDVLARSDLSPWQRARVLNRKCNAYSQTNRSMQALELTQQVLELLTSHGFPGRDIIVRDRAMYQTHLGDYRAARTDYEEALQLARAVGRTQNEMGIRYALGQLHGEFGEYALAEECLLEAFDFLVRHPVGEALCDTVNALIELYIAWRERPSSGLLAQKYVRLSLEYARVTGFPAYLAASRTFAGFVELEYGSPTRALELALEAQAFQVKDHQFFGRWFPTWLEAKAQINLGDQTQALLLLERAIVGFEQIGRVVHVNLAGLDLDRLRNDVESARVRLEWFRERGMVNAVRTGLRLFPELANDVIETDPEPRAIAQLQVLGSVHLLIAGKSEPVRGGKRKELLAVLLESRVMGRNEISRLDLIDALYPDMLETQASAALKNLVYQLRELYGNDAIHSTTGGYVLGAITSDAEVFLETADTRLWRGEYLEGLSLGADETVRETLHFALRDRAENLLETDPGEVVRVGRLLCAADPYDLESLRLTLRALRASDNHKGLKSTYARARTDLLEIGEVLPEHWADFLEPQTGKSA
jgi:DNA-binding SARP family transcriptional activator/TPR repeat protein